MSKKKKHAEHVNNERWLVSYADFITLLFAFFVVLFSSAPKDDSNTRTITAATQNSFSTFSIFRGGGSKISGSRMKARGDGIELQPDDENPMITEPSNPDAEVDRQKNMTTSDESYQPTSRMRDSMMQEFFKEVTNNNNLDVAMESRGLVVSFKDVAFFDVGSEKAKLDSLKTLESIMLAVGDRKNLIQIEGHSDGTEADRGTYKTNMEISTQRAHELANVLIEKFNVPPEYISTVGYGGFRADGDKNTEAGRKKNRRVDLVLIKSVPDAQKMALPQTGELDPLAFNEPTLPLKTKMAEGHELSQSHVPEDATLQHGEVVHHELPMTDIVPVNIVPDLATESKSHTVATEDQH